MMDYKIYESAYLNMFQNQNQDKLININEILNNTTAINEILLTLEETLLEKQKMLNNNEVETEQKLLNLNICIDAINKIKQNLSEINQQTTVISDSMEKI